MSLGLAWVRACRVQEAALKAIETKYKGYRFRSRLEARWAVFFDTLGIEYRYEYEGFEMWTGTWYLPDFYLPEQGYWIEIKGTTPTALEREKASNFSLDLFGQALDRRPAGDPTDDLFTEIMCICPGDIPWPYPKVGTLSSYDSAVEHFNLCWQQCPVCRKLGIDVLGEPYCKRCLERVRKATAFEIEAAQLNLPTRQASLSNEPLHKASSAIVNTDFFRSGHKSDSLQLAYAEARAARF
jgi:hypothetical protein